MIEKKVVKRDLYDCSCAIVGGFALAFHGAPRGNDGMLQ